MDPLDEVAMYVGNGRRHSNEVLERAISERDGRGIVVPEAEEEEEGRSEDGV
jgi:hypothetical protein